MKQPLSISGAKSTIDEQPNNTIQLNIQDRREETVDITIRIKVISMRYNIGRFVKQL